MTKDELLKILEECNHDWESYEDYDTERDHIRSDAALLKYIDDVEISAAFDEKGYFWYA